MKRKLAKNFLIKGLFFLFFLSYPLLSQANCNWVISSYPLYKIFKEIYLEKNLCLIQPPKGEFHFSEPSPKEWELIKKSDLVILVGTEPWAKRVEKLLSSNKILTLTEKVEKIRNPHLWFDLSRIETIIKRSLELPQIKTDLQFKEYQKRSEAFLRRLKQIEKGYQNLSTCSYKNFYNLGHKVFTNLLKDTLIKEVALIEGHHHGEISSKKLLNFLTSAKKEGIKKIILTEREFIKYKNLFEKEGISVMEVWSGDRDIPGGFLDLLEKNLTIFKEVLNCL